MPETFATRNPVDQVEVERDIEELLNLFFKEYFDGATHTIGSGDTDTENLSFDQCDLVFGVTVLPAASANPLIHTVINDTREVRIDRTGDSTRVIERDVDFSHFVRVPHQGNNEKRARFTARRIADRIRLLYDHATALDLARKGFLRVKIERGPVELPMPGYATRLLAVSCRLRLEQTVSTIGG